MVDSVESVDAMEDSVDAVESVDAEELMYAMTSISTTPL
jgi:hypothetical protein